MTLASLACSLEKRDLHRGAGAVSPADCHGSKQIARPTRPLGSFLSLAIAKPMQPYRQILSPAMSLFPRSHPFHTAISPQMIPVACTSLPCQTTCPRDTTPYYGSSRLSGL